jgi:RNA polymerase sigma-70 factor (ECF subfamily)
MPSHLSPSLLPSVLSPARELLASHTMQLEDFLAERWTAARRTWPTVALDPALFWPYLGARIPADVSTIEELDDLHTDELYLACACEAGNQQAFAALEDRYFPGVVSSLSRIRLDAARIAELKQQLRQRLFMSQAGKRPKVAVYTGRGDFGSWLRVVAVRAALRLLRDEKRLPLPTETDQIARLCTDGESELRYLKRHYRPLFRQAFARAVTTLDSRDKKLLRQYYVDGLTIDQIGVRSSAHRMTVTRWLAAIRQRLLDETRSELMQRVRVSQQECDSIIRLVQSQFELTFRAMLANGG